MREKFLAVELRLPPGAARFGIAALLLVLCGGPTITQNVEFSTHYLSPAGVYSGMTVAGLNPDGTAANTYFNTTNVPGSAVGIRSGTGVLPANANLAVHGSMVVGGNVGTPWAGTHVQGSVGVQNRTPGWGDTWSVYAAGPPTYDLVLQNNTFGGVALMDYQSGKIYPGGAPICTPVFYWAGGPNAYCPAGYLALTTMTWSAQWWIYGLYGGPGVSGNLAKGGGNYCNPFSWSYYCEYFPSVSSNYMGYAEIRRVALTGAMLCCQLGTL